MSLLSISFTLFLTHFSRSTLPVLPFFLSFYLISCLPCYHVTNPLFSYFFNPRLSCLKYVYFSLTLFSHIFSFKCFSSIHTIYFQTIFLLRYQAPAFDYTLSTSNVFHGISLHMPPYKPRKRLPSVTYIEKTLTLCHD